MEPPARLSFDAAVRDGGDALRASLRHHGYVHVTGVVSPAECDAWAADLRALVARLGFRGRFGDADSVADPARWPRDCAEGIFGSYGAGHTEAAWRGRTHARVVALQAAYWGTEQLATSCDGVNAELPHLGRRRRSDAQALRLHLDQNPFHAASGRDAIQGVLSLTPTARDGGGTTVVAGSHRECVANALFPPGHQLPRESHTKHLFYRLTADELRRLLATPGCALVHVETAAGDVVLFSSLAVHCGRRARAPARDAHAWRFALYSTCVPAARLTAAHHAHKRRVLGIEPWPHSGVRRAETTNHPPDGTSVKPRFGFGAHSPPPGVSVGITEPPAWVLNDHAVLRLAGAEAYPPAPVATAGAAPAASVARLGGAKRVAEADVETQRAARLARFGAPEVVIIDD